MVAGTAHDEVNGGNSHHLSMSMMLWQGAHDGGRSATVDL